MQVKSKAICYSDNHKNHENLKTTGGEITIQFKLQEHLVQKSIGKSASLIYSLKQQIGI